MFPNLRLMLSASLATIVLVAIVGANLVLVRPPPAHMADMPDIVRPVVPIAEDGRPPLRVDPSARRHEELQRLLALPPGPVRAYAAEPPAAFPYAVTATGNSDAADTSAPADETPAVSAAIAAPVPAAASPAEPEPATETQAPAVVAAVPEPAGQAEPEPIRQPEPEPVRPTGPAAGVAEQADPVTTASIPVADATAPAAPETAAPEVETFPVSSIPVIDEAPIPRPKPQMALADPQTSAEKAGEPQVKASRPQRAKARPRRRATLTKRIRQPLPPPTAFESREGQFPVFDNGAVRDGSEWQGHRRERPDATADSANSSQPQRRAYGIRPPTAAVR